MFKPLKRLQTFAIPVPTDTTPIPAPKLTFGTQAAKNGFQSGFFTLGVVDLAQKAFKEHSKFKDDPGAEDIFLFSLTILKIQQLKLAQSSHPIPGDA